MPVIVAKLELCNVERQIFAADLVIAANDAALHQRPEAFNRVRMDGTDDAVFDDVLARAVVDDTVPILAADAARSRKNRPCRSD